MSVVEIEPHPIHFNSFFDPAKTPRVYITVRRRRTATEVAVQGGPEESARAKDIDSRDALLRSRKG